MISCVGSVYMTQNFQIYYKFMTYLEYRSNFVTLQVVMKIVYTKVTAVLLIVWYSMSIIGFGVHTCSGSGKSFVVTFVEGFGCEDVHPEHHCSKGSCCSHTHCSHSSDEGVNVKSRSCCSSDYQVLALTGTVSDEKSGTDVVIHAAYTSCNAFNILSADDVWQDVISHRHRSVPMSGRMPDRQASLSVWRI